MPIGPDKARGNPSHWPLPGQAKRVATYGGLAFGAKRSHGERYHAGVDLLAPRGVVVAAPEAGTIVASQRFNGPNAHALLLQTDSGPTLLLGEVEPGSWLEFGVDVGARVEAGEPVARVGINPGGSTMLHFETYEPGTTSNQRWLVGTRPPFSLLDPTAYLKQAADGPVVGIPSTEPHETEDPPPPDDPVVIPPGPGDTPPLDPAGDNWQFDPWVPEAIAEQTVEWAQNERPVLASEAMEYIDAGTWPPWGIRPEIGACGSRGGEWTPGGERHKNASGICSWPDGSECGAVDFMLGDCEPGVEPPDPIDPVDPIEPPDPIDPVDPIDPFPIDPDPRPGSPLPLLLIALLTEVMS